MLVCVWGSGGRLPSGRGQCPTTPADTQMRGYLKASGTAHHTLLLQEPGWGFSWITVVSGKRNVASRSPSVVLQDEKVQHIG